MRITFKGQLAHINISPYVDTEQHNELDYNFVMPYFQQASFAMGFRGPVDISQEGLRASPAKKHLVTVIIEALEEEDG